MKGQLTIINIVVLLLTLFAVAFIARIFYPVLDVLLLPALQNAPDSGMGYNLSLLIFPIIIIAIVVMIWLWAKPLA